jgi:hypothetical protein
MTNKHSISTSSTLLLTCSRCFVLRWDKEATKSRRIIGRRVLAFGKGKTGFRYKVLRSLVAIAPTHSSSCT